MHTLQVTYALNANKCTRKRTTVSLQGGYDVPSVSSRLAWYSPNASIRLDDIGPVADWIMGIPLFSRGRLRVLSFVWGSPWVGPVWQAYDPTLGL